MATEAQTDFALKQLVAIGTFPNDYTRDDLIRYMTVLEAQAYDHLETIEQLKARIRELEQRQQKFDAAHKA